MISKSGIMDALAKKKFSPSKPKQLSALLGISPEDYISFKNILKELAQEGFLIRLSRNRYALSSASEYLVTGRLEVVRDGFGFLLPDDRTRFPDDIYISSRDIRGAIDGDRVLVRIKRQRRHREGGRLKAGVVEKILNRKNRMLVGTLMRSGNRFYITPQKGLTRLPYRRIPVLRSDLGGAVVGEKVVVQLPVQQNPRAKPVCKVVETLGTPLDMEVEERSLLVEFGVERGVPDEVSVEEEKLLQLDYSSEVRKRKDLRKLLCFTIDPADAYDFDDAISVYREKEGYHLMVHIADVSHFVRPKSVIDVFARERLNSIYLPTIVVPMLPEALTKNVACLSEGCERLAKTVSVHLDRDGDIRGFSIFKSVIRNRRRLDYEEAAEVIDSEREPLNGVEKMLRDGYELASLLRRKRLSRGAIDMEIPEQKAVLDEKGNLRDIVFRERLSSHILVEEFMLLSNYVVAEYLTERGVTFIRRIHESPDEDSMRRFAAFAESMGMRLRRWSAGAIQRLLRSASRKPLAYPLNYALLRSMKRALYTTRRVGHFALALDNYTHFTSPIRRYVDLTVHRILDTILNASGENEVPEKEALDIVAADASEKESLTDRLEREFFKLKACYLLKDRIGEVFDGVIVSVSERAFYVLLEKPAVEGVVPERVFKEPLLYEPMAFSLIARSKGRTFRIGHRIKVRLIAVDIPSRSILFMPV